MEIITIRPTIKQQSKTDEVLILDSTGFNPNEMETLQTPPSAEHFSVSPFNKDITGNDETHWLC